MNLPSNLLQALFLEQRLERELLEHLEQVVTGHSRLPGDTGRDDDNITASQCLTQLIITCIALEESNSCSACLCYLSYASKGCFRSLCEQMGRKRYLGNGLGVYVADVSSNARGAGDIVEGELADIGVHLQA